MLWKSKNGDVVSISEMSLQHLKNSINFCKKNGLVDSHSILVKEMNRRKEESFLRMERQCPFCRGTMPMKRLTWYDEERWIDPVEYRYVCDKCGAQSNEHDRSEFSL